MWLQLKVSEQQERPTTLQLSEAARVAGQSCEYLVVATC
jgi:hypothetical protein